MASNNDSKEFLRGQFLQICRDYFEGSTYVDIGKKIGENDKIISAICTGSRELGLTTIIRLLKSTPEINANWLLVGHGEMTNTPRPKLTNQSDGAIGVLRDMLREKDREISNLSADIRERDIEISNLKEQISRYVTSKGVLSGTETTMEYTN